MTLYRAQKIIQENVSASELDLEGLSITTLEPLRDLLGQMTQLRTLRLAHNKLSGLPTDLSFLSALVSLDLKDNLISGLGDVIGGLQSLSNLKHLWIDLRREEEADEVILKMPSLESLNGTSLVDDLEGIARAPYRYNWRSSGEDSGVVGAPSCWSPDDTAGAEDLHTAMLEGIGSSPDAVADFQHYMDHALQVLGTVTSLKRDRLVQAGEALRVKRIIYNYCWEKLLSGLTGDGPIPVKSLYAIHRYGGALLDDYDDHWRRIVEGRDRQIVAMQTEVRDAITEFDALLAYVKECSRDNVVSENEGASCAALQKKMDQLYQENQQLQKRLQQVMDNHPPQMSVGNFSGGRCSNRLRSPDPAVRNSPSRLGSSPSAARGVRVLTLRQLRDTIAEIYASKSKYDCKCTELGLPRETMEQHMYTFLNQRYGLRELIFECAIAIVDGVKRYAGEDRDIAVFGKILRNEVDEEFRLVQQKLREAVPLLLRSFIKAQLPREGEMQIRSTLQKKMNGTLQEGEWEATVRYMYNSEDAAYLCQRIKDYVQEQPIPRRPGGRQKGASSGTAPLLYSDFIQLLLDFQLEVHERFLAPYLAIFRVHDEDHNGIINRDELRSVVHDLHPHKTEEEVEALLERILPCGMQHVTFSDSVTLLADELEGFSAPGNGHHGLPSRRTDEY